MTRALLLLLLAAPAARAQTALFPAGDAGRAVPHWRAALSAGGSDDAESAVVSLGLDRTVSGPFSVGVRVAVPVDLGFSEDGGRTTGASGELRATVGTALRAFDMRAFAGAGVSSFLTPGFAPVIEFDAPPFIPEERRLRGRAVAGVGLDVYLAAGVGVGIEVRGTLPTGAAELSAGLRIRLAR